uniref:Uncharacterized protein n=1 Tax=Oryza barthii TaxID=65489 RepID=A0A0D3GMN6_9ORYZ
MAAAAAAAAGRTFKTGLLRRFRVSKDVCYRSGCHFMSTDAKATMSRDELHEKQLMHLNQQYELLKEEFEVYSAATRAGVEQRNTRTSNIIFQLQTVTVALIMCLMECKVDILPPLPSSSGSADMMDFSDAWDWIDID